MQPVTQIADALIQRIREMQSVAVAFSGGVDSAVVAKAAALALSDRAVAVTAVSPSLATAEHKLAREVATQIGIRHVELSTREFNRPEYRRNAGDRCFFCKDTLYELTSSHMTELGALVLINGSNTDDLGDYRPGMKAADNYSVRSPLIELGIDKSTVRELARHWGLTVADKPASPCLASRVAYGVEVTEERVHRIDQAETLIRSLTGIQELRVRLEAGELARIEVPKSQIDVLIQPAIRDQITKGLRSFGFRSVTIDLEGFRSGNLNAALAMESGLTMVQLQLRN